jgi:hypothetical protein
MGGDVLTSLLVIHPRTIDHMVWKEGWCNGGDFGLRQNDSSYITQDIFDNDRVFHPDMNISISSE